MVTEALVNEARKFLHSFEMEGKHFRFAALVPIYPYFSDTPYTLVVDAEWLDKLPYGEALDLLVDRLFEVTNSKTRLKLNGMDVYSKGRTYPLGTEAEILIDEAGLGKYFNHPGRTTPAEAELLGALIGL